MIENLENLMNKILYSVDLFVVAYILILIFFKRVNNIIFILGVILTLLFIIKYVVFIITYYNNQYINIPGCDSITGNTSCSVRNKTCIPNECGSYETINRYFNIYSYDKYMTENKDLSKNPTGSSKDYDIKRLSISEGLSIASFLVYILMLYFIHRAIENEFANPGNGGGYDIIWVRIFKLLILGLSAGTIIYFIYNERNDYSLISVSIINLLALLFSFSNSNMMYFVSILFILPFIIFPRLIDRMDYCTVRTQKACVKDEDDASIPSCKWDKINRICVNFDKNINADQNGVECNSLNDEESCLNNNCYYVKLNVNESDVSTEGISKINSKKGCIETDTKCKGYSCSSEFYPLNIFDDCCNAQLYNNGCDQDELQNHLDSDKETLDETKDDDSEIKTLYGDEAWSKKVDFDESYRYCESKNRRSELDAGIYA